MTENEILCEKLDHLKQWFKENPNLPTEINLTLLRRFLKCVNGDLEETKKLLELNYQLRNKSPHLFINRDPNDELTKTAFETVDMLPLPGVTEDNYKILCFRLVEKDVKLQNTIEGCKAFFLMTDARLIFSDLDDDLQTEEEVKDMDLLASGEIHILDIANYTLRHIASMSLTTMRTYNNFLIHAYPVRLKALHIINCPTSLNHLTLLRRFLKCVNGDLEETKKLLELNYQLRNKSPHLFINRDPNDELTKTAFETVDMLPLPGVTEDNNKILCFRLVEKDVKLQNTIEGCKAFFLMTDARLIFSDLDDDLQTEEVKDMDLLASGEIHILDIANYTLRHIASMSLTTMRTYNNFLIHAYPVRLKALHIINCPTSLNRMVAIMRPFIPDEVFKMIHFHTEGIESLYDHVPRDMLPSEYGGKAGYFSEIKIKWRNILQKKRDYLMDPEHWKLADTATKTGWFWR